MKIFLLAGFVTAMIAAPAFPGDEQPTSVGETNQDLIPKHEREIARQSDAEGPSETTGIESSVVLGTIALTGEFESLDGYVLRAREVTVAPGGQVAVHRHDSRPGVAYVLEGEVVEHRRGEEPAVRRLGDTAFENSSVVHWWRNESQFSARVLVVDIVPSETP